jgi:hypothetical protein
MVAENSHRRIPGRIAARRTAARRPRAWGTFLAHSGGIGAPPGPTTGACQELADGGRRAKSEVVKERLTQKAPWDRRPKTERSSPWAKRGPVPEGRRRK